MKKSSKHPTPETKKHDNVTSALLTELPFEDKLWLVWKKYNRHITLVIVLLIFGFIGYKGIDFYKTSQIERLQNEYRTALEGGQELAFAEANIKDPLAGSVFLSKGDQLVNDGKFEEAIVNYNKSLNSLKSTPFGDRARLGIGLVTWMKGDKDSSKKLLNDIISDRQVMGAIRAEAAYQLALIALKEKDFGRAKEFLDTVKLIPNSGIWGQKALILRDSTPGLSSKV
jgi:hypothetical protein